ncbi:acetyltransferase (GNAT) family protein [Fontibacillus phaseoli]|uniref:Acetyltransferase (GNAT) family protein n=2 Tax=Fontibacillus phaseoli TaxID=1416533 RepID=A0A369BLH2_9BACL|nr:GNAT family N-acetyltransferase [Fontibacillus phaseoli]RCX21468.1 acetyltransferase (GNAT) family protein [Fontibacillus phaseoli]
MQLTIEKLLDKSAAPYDLLLLADPSKVIVDDYLSRGTCYIASWNNERVGVFVILQTRPDMAEIMNIAVKEADQGKGIGKKLLLNAIHLAKEMNFKTIEIGTGNSSIAQLALYQKCGFRIVGVEPDFFVRHYVEDIYENGIQCRDMIRLRMNL